MFKPYAQTSFIVSTIQMPHNSVQPQTLWNSIGKKSVSFQEKSIMLTPYPLRILKRVWWHTVTSSSTHCCHNNQQWRKVVKSCWTLKKSLRSKPTELDQNGDHAGKYLRRFYFSFESFDGLEMDNPGGNLRLVGCGEFFTITPALSLNSTTEASSSEAVAASQWLVSWVNDAVWGSLAVPGSAKRLLQKSSSGIWVASKSGDRDEDDDARGRWEAWLQELSPSAIIESSSEILSMYAASIQASLLPTGSSEHLNSSLFSSKQGRSGSQSIQPPHKTSLFKLTVVVSPKAAPLLIWRDSGLWLTEVEPWQSSKLSLLR